MPAVAAHALPADRFQDDSASAADLVGVTAPASRRRLTTVASRLTSQASLRTRGYPAGRIWPFDLLEAEDPAQARITSGGSWPTVS
jgi:hypothetical protein